MVCGTADILMKFLSLDWFGLGYDCFCKRLHARKLIGKASPKEATTRGFLALDLFANAWRGGASLFDSPPPTAWYRSRRGRLRVVAHMLVVVVYEDQFGQNDSRQLARWYR